MPTAFPRFFVRTSIAAVAAVGALAAARDASAENPILRHQEDLQGDVVVFGSTLAHDCDSPVPVPAGATAKCEGQTNLDDTSPDLYWRDKMADATIEPTQARTSATLTLPPGAKVTYARLYWAALRQGDKPDETAVLDWLGGPTQTIKADKTWVVKYPFESHPDWYYYQASGDATSFVSKWGAGDFRVTDVEALPLAGVTVDRAFAAWTLVVFYENPGDPLRNLALFDSFTSIDPGIPGQESASVLLKGFLVPKGFQARMSAITYEGDLDYLGDHFTINGVKVTDAQNPADNFFNSSRSFLGAPVSGPFDVPKLSGLPGSMGGYDLDTIDITKNLKAGDTSATVGAASDLDIFFLGGFVTSVQSLTPDFDVTKTATDVNGGAVLPGDVLEFTITATNTGNDHSAGTVITDSIEPGLTYVPGTIEIVKGANKGVLTDAKGDDPGEFDAASKTITVRVGTGANATDGGSVAPGETIEVRFKAKVAIEEGTVSNQAVLKASGASGAPEKTYLSDGDPAAVGDQPTKVPVNECSIDADCPADKPHCDQATATCVGCKTDADCTNPDLPACQPDGSCGECSATNDSKCLGDEPVCDTDQGICVLCTVGPDGDSSACVGSPDGPVCVASADGTVHCGCLEDADCGGPDSGLVCDDKENVCVLGCRGEDGNGCPEGETCTSTDLSIGECVQQDDGTGGGGSGKGSSGADTQSPGEEGGCACTTPGDRRVAGALGPAAAVLGLAALVVRRRRRS